eukprot:gene1128-1463_t
MQDADMQQSLVYGGKGTGVYFGPAVLPALQRSPKQKLVQALGSAACSGAADVPAATPAVSPFSSRESHGNNDGQLGEPQGNLDRSKPLGLGMNNPPVPEGIQDKLPDGDVCIRLTAAQLKHVQQTKSRDSRLHKLRHNMEAVSSSCASARTAAGLSTSSGTGPDPSNADQQPPALAQSISSRNNVAGEGDASSAAGAAADNTSLMRIQNSPQLQRLQLWHQIGSGSLHAPWDCTHTSSSGSSLDIPGIGSSAATALLLCPEATADGDAASRVSYEAEPRLEDASRLSTLAVHRINPTASAGARAVPPAWL